MAFNINTLFIDLDGCLITSKLTASVPNKVAQYAVKYLGYDIGSAAVKCGESYRRNGTNLEGFLQQGHVIDPEHYHDFIHASLPYEYHLRDMPDVRRTLNAIPVDKYVFTNADEKHTRACLERTGLSDCFKGLVCFETLQSMYDGPYTACKPKSIAMDLALKFAAADALTSLLFDDQVRNVHMSMDAGVRAVLIGEDDPTCAYFERLPSLVSLRSRIFSSYFT
jgi:putative hydrolase of the HAD superfamily